MQYAYEDFVHHVAIHTGVHVTSVKRFVLLDIVCHDQCRPAIIVSREKPRFRSNLLSPGDRDAILRFTSLPGILEEWALHHQMTVHASECPQTIPTTRFPNKQERCHRHMSTNVWYLVMDNDDIMEGNRSGDVADDSCDAVIVATITSDDVDGGTNDDTIRSAWEPPLSFSLFTNMYHSLRTSIVDNIGWGALRQSNCCYVP